MAPRPKLATRIGAGVATLAAIGAVGGALAWNQAQTGATLGPSAAPVGSGVEDGAGAVPARPVSQPDPAAAGEYGGDGFWYPDYEDDGHASRYEDDSDWGDDEGWDDEQHEHEDDDYDGEYEAAPASGPSAPSSVAPSVAPSVVPSVPAAPSQGSTRTS